MSNRIANIHDSFFKRALGDPELARTFLREHLPPDIVELLGPERPELLSGSFVDEELRQHHTDLLFRVHLKTGTQALAYILVEHKSAQDKAARLQLLRYVVRVLNNWYVQNGKKLPLPPVMPLLVHQGPKEWKFSREFTDLFGVVPGPLAPYLPSFRHALVDFATTDDRDLSTEVRLRAYLKALKYSRREELPQLLDIILADTRALGQEDVCLIVAYLDKGPIALDRGAIYNVLQKVVPERKEEVMGWISQPYVEEGRAEGLAAGRAQGIAEGKAQGRAEAKADTLVRLLKKRFGAVPAHIRQRVLSADLASIEGWLERVIDAPDVESVFVSE